jgi:hypothetical protein
VNYRYAVFLLARCGKRASVVVTSGMVILFGCNPSSTQVSEKEQKMNSAARKKLEQNNPLKNFVFQKS